MIYVTDEMSDEEVVKVRDLGLRIFKDADSEIVRRQRVAVTGTLEERRRTFRLVTT